MVFNWIDGAIIFVILCFFFKGLKHGGIAILASFLSFIASFLVSLRYNLPVSSFITEKFGVSPSWATVVSYIVIAFMTEMIFSEVLGQFVELFPKKLHASPVNKILGSILSSFNAVILIAFILILLVNIPLRGTIKQDIGKSYGSKKILSLVNRYAGSVVTEVEDSAKELTKFLTIKPQSRERVPLEINPPDGSLVIDDATERQMIEFVNNERIRRSILPLVPDEKIRAVARAYSRTMLVERFFSHIDSNGNDVAFRLEEGGVSFYYAGENLAYAPDLATAHEGLMNSEGHRRNILEPRFHRVGIGVIDAGYWGKMFTQVFAN